MDSHYRTVPKVDEPNISSIETEEAERTVPAKRSRLSWLWSTSTQLLGFLWLAPIILLLYFNFTGHVIGPSASCPLSGCKADPLATGNSQWALELDRNDHNTLGAMQLVAKVLELWFLFVAINLVYNVAMMLASHEGGLPIGLLSSPVEFADPRSLLEIFRSASHQPGQHQLKRRALLQMWLYLFVVFLAIMCVAVNLMGPAVAVLVLPTLQWKDLPRHAKYSFSNTGLDQLSDGGNLAIAPWCVNEDVAARRYNCTGVPYAASLDTWVDSVVTSDSQNTAYYSVAQSDGISPEGDVFFTFNTTVNPYDVSWAPNRQTLREISSDLDFFETASRNLSRNTAFQPYNSSLNTILRRKGPILGSLNNIYYPENITRIVVGEDREVNCYRDYKSWIAVNGNYTKCLRIGTGWNPLNKKANFAAVPSSNSSSELELASVNVYFSDKASYFNDTFNPGLVPSSCFRKGILNSPDGCDWDNIFSSDPPENASIVSNNILSIEMRLPNYYPTETVVFEFFTYANFSTYTLDTSPQTNPLYLVQVDDVPDPQKDELQTVPVDPDWFLAAWSVNQGGLIANRSAALNLIGGLESALDPGPYPSNNSTLEGSGYDESISTSTASDSIPSLDSAGPSSASSMRSSNPTTTAISESSSIDFDQSHRMKREDISTANATGGAASISSEGWPPTSTGLTPEADEETEENDSYYVQDSLSDYNENKISTDLENLVVYSYLQALSMVTYTKANLTHRDEDTKDPQHPTLWYYARVHVWAYGTDSRTSKLGITVTLFGVVCVLMSTILGIASRRRQRSLTELLVAAIEHRHQGELDHAQGDEGLKARTRYRIHEGVDDERVQFKALL